MLKNNIPSFLFVILMAGLFVSRALLSITLILWASYAILQLINNKNRFFKSPLFIWSSTPIFLWILGAWQNSLSGDSLNYLLTLTAYPATVCIVESISMEVIEKKMIRIWLIATCIGVSYPVIWYLFHFTASNNAYGSGKSLPTLMDSDYVRFSIFLCSSFLFLLIFPIFKKSIAWILTSVLFLLILFLSVRTGWVMAISILFCYSLFEIKNSISGKLIFPGIILFTSILVLSYLIVPTIHQKIAYSIWDWQQFQPGKYDPNYSDGTRRAINLSAWNSINNRSNINAGWSGISNILQESFTRNFGNQKTEYGWPFNQWLFWWMGSGWWGMLLFTGWLLYPLFINIKKIDAGLICWTIAIALSCIVESTLNYQFGVFLHIWPIAFMWKKATSKSGSS